MIYISYRLFSSYNATENHYSVTTPHESFPSGMLGIFVYSQPLEMIYSAVQRNHTRIPSEEDFYPSFLILLLLVPAQYSATELLDERNYRYMNMMRGVD